MTQPKTILTAAQAIRPHLSSLLDPDTAERIDRELYYLLAQAESGQNVENQITELLRQPEPTQSWMRRYFKGEKPEEITRSSSSYSNLAGDPALQPAPRYVCPRCDSSWYREDNEPIPECPNHHIPLVPAQT
jgi:hypothetical protein